MSDSLARLVTMHAYCRPAGSTSELAFIERYIKPLGATRDRWGNWSVVVGDAPRVVWSCHTDTVHTRVGSQRVQLSAAGILSAPPIKLAVPVSHPGWRCVGVGGKVYESKPWVQTHADNSGCLGADDTAGCWLLCELIRRGVPGRYLFHYGEEEGCQGSRALANDIPSWADDVDMVIALDRKGTGDVITHQCAARTCSDAFADSLADHLNDCGLTYAASSHGLYTDSESYAGLVAECTNLSIGYAGNHSQAETLDTGHCLRLLDALEQLDTTALVIARDAFKADYWGRDYAWSSWDSGTGAAERVHVSDDDIVDVDLSLPVAAGNARPWSHWCRDCGAGISEYAMVCFACGCDDPASEDTYRASRSDYLDPVMAEVQAELRMRLIKGDR